MADTAEDTTPAGLRATLDRKDERIKEMQEKINQQKVHLLERAFDEAGLDPTKGVGKAVAKEYEGDPTKDAIQAFAREEYGWEPTPEQTNEMAAAVTEAQGRVSGVTATGVSTPTQEIDLDIASAEKAGNFAESIRLKMQKWRTESGR